jgi:hypothetical protein
MRTPAGIGVRWTVGDVSREGFQALQLAVWGARRVFGAEAEYCICVNSLPLEEAKARTGPLPAGVGWREASGTLPDFIRAAVDEGMAEGTAWKFDPMQVFPDRWSISFDNDCILWSMPESVRRWLEAGDRERCLIAADVATYHGIFTELAGMEPRNSGIRGIPPGFDLEGVFRRILRESPAKMRSETDEQGLQVAAASYRSAPVVVSVEEVSICSPFPPHLPDPGRNGAHFVGLNARALPWKYYDRPASELVREHWRRHRPGIAARVGAPVGSGAGAA